MDALDAHADLSVDALGRAAPRIYLSNGRVDGVRHVRNGGPAFKQTGSWLNLDEVTSAWFEGAPAAERALDAMTKMKKIDVAINAARRG